MNARQRFFQRRALGRKLAQLRPCPVLKAADAEAARARSLAAAYVREMMGATPCTDCGRTSAVFRDGKVRRPMSWKPEDGSWSRINNMVRRGAGLDELQAEMARCIPICQPCERKRQG